MSERHGTRVALVGGHGTSTTNAALVLAWARLGLDVDWVAVEDLAALGRDDVVVARLDVRPSLDGVEPGLLSLLPLSAEGVRVVNRPAALLAAHDKLLAARRLVAAGLPHPATAWLGPDAREALVQPPLVVKPRFGSWGSEVFRCESEAAFASTLEVVAERPWFRRQGAVLQELVPPRGHDLRLLVANGRVVGAIRRRARPGEWRTNYSLGGTLEPTVPAGEPCRLALRAAVALGADFVGVDLLPGESGYVVLEVNGAADFTADYALPGEDVYEAVAAALDLARGAELRASTSSRAPAPPRIPLSRGRPGRPGP